MLLKVRQGTDKDYHQELGVKSTPGKYFLKSSA